MTQEETLEFLEHYGIRGMKWGVRNDKRPMSGDYKSTIHLRKRHTNELSNRQIRTVNDRINLEMQYRRLNPSTVQVGRRAARGMLGLATTAASVYYLANSPAGKAFISVGKQWILSGKILKLVK